MENAAIRAKLDPVAAARQRKCEARWPVYCETIGIFLSGMTPGLEQALQFAGFHREKASLKALAHI
jgi:hypothetical protein